MWSRQKECARGKAVTFPGYFSYTKMIDKIFRPSWQNILDEESTILFNRDEFLEGLSKFVGRFDMVDIEPEPLPIAKPSDASGYVFTLHMDYCYVGRDTDESLATILALVLTPPGAVGAAMAPAKGPTEYAVGCAIH